MGIIESLTGWEYLGEVREPKKKIQKDIIKWANEKSRKISSKLERKEMKQGNIYRDMRGGKLAKSIPSFKFHINGKTFIYRFKEPSARVGEGNGHGFYMGGSMKVWRKLKEDK